MTDPEGWPPRNVAGRHDITTTLDSEVPMEVTR